VHDNASDGAMIAARGPDSGVRTSSAHKLASGPARATQADPSQASGRVSDWRVRVVAAQLPPAHMLATCMGRPTGQLHACGPRPA